MRDDTFTIKLDLSMMAQTIHGRIEKRSDEVQTLVNLAVEDYCKNGGLEHDIKVETQKAIQESVGKYFYYGNGRARIDKEVHKMLDEMLSPNEKEA